MEKVALIFSIMSLATSISLTIWQIITTIKINKINLQSSVCEKIFDEFLITTIPQARKYIKFDCKGKFTGGEKINHVVVQMKKSSLYFMYNDKKFYTNLESKMTELEDYIASLMDKEFDSIKHAEIYNKIDELIKELYRLIENKKIKG